MKKKYLIIITAAVLLAAISAIVFYQIKGLHYKLKTSHNYRYDLAYKQSGAVTISAPNNAASTFKSAIDCHLEMDIYPLSYENTLLKAAVTLSPAGPCSFVFENNDLFKDAGLLERTFKDRFALIQMAADFYKRGDACREGAQVFKIEPVNA